MSVAAIIIAAGYSSRMGRFKPILPVGKEGNAGLERLIEACKEGGTDPIIVVTGFRRELLLDIIEKKGAVECHNADFDKGMFSSIKAGIGWLAKKKSEGEPPGALLMPVDSPLIPAAIVSKMVSHGASSREEKFIIPCFQGKKGHPVYIPEKFFEEILDYDGEGGLKSFIHQKAGEVRTYEVGDERVVLDMDDEEGYQDLLEFEKKGGRPSLVELTRDRRLVLVRHCQTIQHEEKIFAGQYDVPLSREGRKDAVSLGERLRSLGFSLETVVFSDLKRAAETAELLGGIRGIPDKNLREIYLGPWEGKFIREIKEKFPDQYRLRGEDMAGYKIDPFCENFYDVRYRAVKTLVSILEKEAGNSPKNDLIVVTHSGVIKSVLSHVAGIKLGEALGMPLKKGDFVVIHGGKILTESGSLCYYEGEKYC